MTKGTITQVIGPVVDVRFSASAEGGSASGGGAVTLPAIKNALVWKEKDRKVVFEVAQHLGINRVRTIAMSATDGLVRGMEVTDTGGPISVPVGEASLGRLFNVLGDPIDGKPEPDKNTPRSVIHRDAP